MEEPFPFSFHGWTLEQNLLFLKFLKDNKKNVQPLNYMINYNMFAFMSDI